MIIDCAVHPVLPNEEFNREVGGPWNLLALPSLYGDRYAAPFDQLAVDEAEAASPAAIADRLLNGAGADYAVLAPTARGYWPNPQQAAAVSSAANRMTAKLLDTPEADGRFLGSIRLSMNDTDTALREIDRWADDDRFVQLVVPARALATYGEQRFFPIWRAAVERGLVVFVHDDLGMLVEPPPTQVGFPSFFSEVHALRPLSGITHLTSFIVAGVFERLPELRVVFGDVSVHAARSLAIRTDKDWQSDRLEVPWVSGAPTSYLQRHVRFITQPEDTVSPHSARAAGSVGGDNSSLVMYGSRHPYWDGVGTDEVFPDWSAQDRDRVLAGNAAEFYPRLAARIAAAPSA
ncbi:amidohydrolase family protein [Streptomyces sp. 8L]|uniref:amidohydrolase family protein n=1 Tax=Streptomyces sp. 8L TaxID=2877242 RepID=UPI001CD78361|nr:amidohydrolase family protein [Streptomyces sp. 8L]MCA1217887.1 amidohydrolase [Streptomyces sp. 8L]